MGVARLLSYMGTNKPQAHCHQVSITQLAEQHRAATQQVPVLLVDASNALYQLYNLESNDWLMGGQLNDCVDNIQQFVNAFKDIGVDVVFYFDGAIPTQMRSKWITRRKERVQAVKEIFRDLYDQTFPFKRHNAQQPPLIGAFARFMMMYLSESQVSVALKDSDKEIVEYAKEHKCFAIMSDDTDFAILGEGQFLSGRHLDLTNMTTLLYDGKALARKLGLRFEQMPLFASLLGTDLLPMSDLSAYHSRLTGPVSKWNLYKVLFSKVVEYVKSQPTGSSLTSILPMIAKNVIGNAQLVEKLEESVAYYALEMKETELEETGSRGDCGGNGNWERILKMAQDKHALEQLPIRYSIMKGEPYDYTTSIEDLNNKALPCAAAAYAELRRRIYGILLDESPGGIETSVEEWCVYNDHTLEACHVLPEPAAVEHPGLIALWTENTPEMEDLRWSLFVQSVSLSLDKDAVRQLPQRYVVPTCVLYYIQHESFGTRRPFTDLEVDSLLAQAVLMEKTKPSELRRLATNRCPPPRAVECSNLFGRGVTLVIELMAVCGFPLKEYMPWLYFDGKLFLSVYTQLTSGKQPGSTGLMERLDKETFNTMRQIIQLECST